MKAVATLSSIAALALAAMVSAATQAVAAPKYAPGVSDTEIKIGETGPFSGPASALSVIGKAAKAKFDQINAEGGVNGRKITLILLDDGYSPPRALQQVRRLVEQDNVMAVFAVIGTPANMAIIDYLDENKIPLIYTAVGSSLVNQPKRYPWTMGWMLGFQAEAKTYVDYVLGANPNPKIAMLHANDGSGRDFRDGVKAALGDRYKDLVVETQTYETSDPSIDQQIIALKTSNADVFLNFGTPKYASLAIRKAAEIGWKPLQIVYNASTSKKQVLEPAGLDNAKGLISGAYMKNPTDELWKDDFAAQEYLAWMKSYYPDGDPSDILNVFGYNSALMLAYTLRQCGDDLTRENLINVATHLQNVQLPMLLPGNVINVTPDDYRLVRGQRMMRFDGEKWTLFSDLLGVSK
jgi:branched-chain amino acid transport system substrate-binding protein